MNKTYFQRLLFFIGSLITGIEIFRFHYRKEHLRLIESKSLLAEFMSETDNTFNLYHILTEYLPLIAFGLVTIVIIRSSKPLKSNITILLPSSAALISSITVLTISDKYYELCEGWYFTHQIGIMVSYYFATLFVLKEVKIKVRMMYFILAVLFTPFFEQIMQMIIFHFNHNADLYFPFGKIHETILAVYLALASLFFFLNKRKILE